MKLFGYIIHCFSFSSNSKGIFCFEFIHLTSCGYNVKMQTKNNILQFDEIPITKHVVTIIFACVCIIDETQNCKVRINGNGDLNQTWIVMRMRCASMLFWLSQDQGLPFYSIILRPSHRLNSNNLAGWIIISSQTRNIAFSTTRY